MPSPPAAAMVATQAPVQMLTRPSSSSAIFVRIKQTYKTQESGFERQWIELILNSKMAKSGVTCEQVVLKYSWDKDSISFPIAFS